jgi:hypothetical protein
MVTYFYWIFVVAISGGTLYLLGFRLQQWLPALVISGVLGLSCVGFYYFYLQQMLVKRWGGSMSITVPDGLQHIAATWKGDNLWIQNYDPQTNTCIFQEYSRGNMLQGEVRLRNCNPLARTDGLQHRQQP